MMSFFKYLKLFWRSWTIIDPDSFDNVMSTKEI
jgi:hypothetical protein